MAILDPGKHLHDTAITLGDPQGDYTELHLTDKGFLTLHAEDATGAVDQVLTIDEAKQLMAALGRQIWIAENELDD